MSTIHLFGIRHHGPGCARSLELALAELKPDCLLVEGPPDGEAMLPFVLDPNIEPPVALLVYNPEDARLAAFYPYAEYSPEWRALRYGLTAQIPTRFIDLPSGVQFALAEEQGTEAAEAPQAQSNGEDPQQEPAETLSYHDPLDWLGRAAGYGDGESWWNHMVEERGDGRDLFAAIREAMATVRNELPTQSRGACETRREALREAHMRKCLREAQKAGHQRIAVVCGAWHVPALENLPSAKSDNNLLKGLPKLKVAATWVPWSNGNLSAASGYGAGVLAPGWYEHLWRHPDRQRGLIAWLAKTARLFRDEDMDCSSAHIIEAARFAETLAALRERPSPGLEEIDEALRTVVCLGEDAPLQLIHRRLVVGDRLGRIPASVPTLPLQRDIEQQQKSLRLKAEALEKTLDLDLRQDTSLARSHLLHRLALLGIRWGELTDGARGAKGTFHEIWRLRWEPELALAIVEASRWGNTVEDAATAKSVARAADATSLPVLARLVDQVLLADLQHAVGPVTQALENIAAVVADASQLLDAIPPLANILRYGNVRRTDAGLVERVLEGMIARATIGLSGACASLDDEAAQAMSKRIADAHQAIRLAGSEAQKSEWLQALSRIAHLGCSHGLINGLTTRLRFDEQADEPDQTATYVSQALSVGNESGAAAAWLAGFLQQSGMVLLHDPRLWTLVDQWVAGLAEDHFIRILPLVRRTFASFSGPERRQLGEQARRQGSPSQTGSSPDEPAWDPVRAAYPLPLLRSILGVTP